MQNTVYLDNSATTKPCERAVEHITRALEEEWGNPSSLHTKGMEAELELNSAREFIAEFIGASAGEIIFTGSGTEANNMALLSALKAKKRGGRVIISSIEHPSISETAKRLEDEGLCVIRLKPNKNGVISLADLEASITDNTVLVSLMLVNNETGAVQPVFEAAELTKRLCPTALFHTDAVQAFGKMPINLRRTKIDLLSASGHKIHGPKGVGFLYCKKGVHIPPLITGGGQENGMRSGTESVPLIMGMLGAVKELPNLSDQLGKTKELFEYTKELILKTGLAEINSPDDALPYILNISVLGYRSETLLHFLESKGIFVSSGSACAKGKGSVVLNEMGLSPAWVDSALRISFSRYNNKEDADRLCAALCDAVGRLKRSSI